MSRSSEMWIGLEMIDEDARNGGDIRAQLGVCN